MFNSSSDIGCDCIRHDIKLTISPRLKRLSIHAFSTTQIQFDPVAKIELEELLIHLATTDSNNMLLPSQSIRAQRATYELTGGRLDGSMTILDKVVIRTDISKVYAKLYVQPLASHSNEPAILETYGGDGPTEIFYERDTSSSYQRPIQSVHRSGNGDMRLNYKETWFFGKVTLSARL
ncbi:hypothetical protein K474DRAFT_1662098 [Panus rudis PR-1116 ss-1]|nr:hypothetical protein K474DRAFT_1662098 [Panus rudis PR-1116 ss-1]